MYAISETVRSGPLLFVRVSSQVDYSVSYEPREPVKEITISERSSVLPGLSLRVQ